MWLESRGLITTGKEVAFTEVSHLFFFPITHTQQNIYCQHLKENIKTKKVETLDQISS